MDATEGILLNGCIGAVDFGSDGRILGGEEAVVGTLLDEDAMVGMLLDEDVNCRCILPVGCDSDDGVLGNEDSSWVRIGRLDFDSDDGVLGNGDSNWGRIGSLDFDSGDGVPGDEAANFDCILAADLDSGNGRRWIRIVILGSMLLSMRSTVLAGVVPLAALVSLMAVDSGRLPYLFARSGFFFGTGGGAFRIALDVWELDVLTVEPVGKGIRGGGT